MYFVPQVLSVLISCLAIGTSPVAANDVNVRICDDGLTLPCDDREGSKEHTAIIHFPPQGPNGNNKLPLVINIHALMSTPEQQRDLSDFDEVADTEGFIVAYPRGFAKGILPTIPIEDSELNKWSQSLDIDAYSWNAGGCCGSASEGEPPVDEIKFFRALIKRIQDDFSKSQGFTLDMERIYVTEISNGGFMTNRVACEMSDIVAAVSPVAGPLMDNTSPPGPLSYKRDESFKCNPENPMPLLHIHGKNDLIVPYDFPNLFGFPSVPDSIDFWCKNNGVKDTPSFEIQHNNIRFLPFPVKISTKCTTYTEPVSKSNRTTAVVELCVHDSNQFFGHCWPSENFELEDIGDHLVQCYNGLGSKYIWNFFKKHTRSLLATQKSDKNNLRRANL